MNIIIIGGTGFIGKELTQLLLNTEHSILLFHRSTSKYSKEPNVREILGERKNLEDFREVFIGFKPDVVVDIVPYTAQDIWLFQKTFLGVTKKIVLISSCDVYQAYDIFFKNLADTIETPLNETSELRSILFPYRHIRTEEYDDMMFNYDKLLVEAIGANSLFITTILRLPAVFGEGDKQQKLAEYIKPMIDNKHSIPLESNKAKWVCTRSYVKNIAYGIFLSILQKSPANNIYNLGDINLTELEIVEKLKSITNWDGTIAIVNEKEPTYNFSQNIHIDISKAKNELKYEPMVDLDTALRDTVNYYR